MYLTHKEIVLMDRKQKQTHNDWCVIKIVPHNQNYFVKCDGVFWCCDWKKTDIWLQSVWCDSKKWPEKPPQKSLNLGIVFALSERSCVWAYFTLTDLNKLCLYHRRRPINTCNALVLINTWKTCNQSQPPWLCWLNAHTQPGEIDYFRDRWFQWIKLQ